MIDSHGIVEMLSEDGQIVLLEMKLDHIDGIEILKKIRSKYHHLPVTLVTGYKEEVAKAVKAGLEIDAFTCL